MDNGNNHVESNELQCIRNESQGPNVECTEQEERKLQSTQLDSNSNEQGHEDENEQGHENEQGLGGGGGGGNYPMGVLGKLVMFEVLLMLFDTASDFSILVSLFNEGYLSLFLIGLFIDLLPGFVTAAFMATSNGYGVKSLLLLVHPWNLVWQSIWTFCSESKEKADFHRKIFLFAKGCFRLLNDSFTLIDFTERAETFALVRV